MQTLVPTKRCSGPCGEEKPVAEFYTRQAWCKSCHKRRVADNNRLTRTGVSPAKYAEMLFLQQGVCAICSNECPTGKPLSVDHDHATEEVRGLLCHPCNTAVGLLRDNPELLEAAAAYLRKDGV
jgi:hypothetical protein